MPQQQAEHSQQNAAVLHAMLLGGTLVFAIIALLAGPMIEEGQLIGHVLAGVSVLVQVGAWMILRPRVVPRPATMLEVEYWLEQDRFGRALMLWAVAEGATFIALVGWLLSGSISAMGVAIVGIGVQVLYRPAMLAGW